MPAPQGKMIKATSQSVAQLALLCLLPPTPSRVHGVQSFSSKGGKKFWEISSVTYPSSKSQVDTNWAKQELGDILKDLVHPVPQQTNAWSLVGVHWSEEKKNIHFSVFLHDMAEKG